MPARISRKAPCLLERSRATYAVEFWLSKWNYARPSIWLFFKASLYAHWVQLRPSINRLSSSSSTGSIWHFLFLISNSHLHYD
jgi:hypothetical protein